MKTSDHITYQQAIDTYFGGINGLNKQKFPFTCKCGDNFYPEKRKDNLGEKVNHQIPLLNVTDCFKHIRRVHKEKIRS